MKSKFLILLLSLIWLSCCKEPEELSAQSVPNTETFSLLDVYNVIHGHTPATTADLNSCIANAVYGYYDQTWYNYYPANSLLRFRNYTVGWVDPCTLSVGDSYGGGIIGYFLVSGDYGYVSGECHGLIIASSDQSLGISWNNGTDITTGATYQDIGYGGINSLFIEVNQGTGSYAAKICLDLTLGGFSDWYLPSIKELVAVGSFLYAGGAQHWSSTESSQTTANFTYQGAWVTPFVSPKGNTYRVRAIRYF
jgi:hypothetical protein